MDQVVAGRRKPEQCGHCFWNARGLSNFCEMTYLEKFSLIFINETMCLDTDKFNIPNFAAEYNKIFVNASIESKSLSGRPSGGLLLLYKKGWVCELSSSDKWYLLVKLSVESSCVIICSVYFSLFASLASLLANLKNHNYRNCGKLSRNTYCYWR